MNTKQWEAAARELTREHASRITGDMIVDAEAAGLGRPLPTDLRRALVEVDRLLRCAPTPIQQRYKRLPEPELRARSVEAQLNFDDGSLAWLDLPDLVAAAAAQVRALDAFLYRHGDVRGKPTDASRDYLCEVTRTHVIPRPSAKQGAVVDVGTPTYRRRGLVRHRLLPEEICGYTVEPCWFKDLSLSFRRENGKVVGAVFDGLSLVPLEGFDGFVAKEAPCGNEDAELDAQVGMAFAGDVTIAAWPELTMPGDRREKLSARLAAHARDAPPATGPTLVAAGSWHEIEEGKVYNRMHILSGSGVYRFSHTKSLPLESRTLGVEQLEPSYRIPVLIAEDALISFAICRDFCEGQITRIYHNLDVDLVVVPSYGDANTIRAHCHQAHALSTDSGTRVFVVQQVVPQEVGASGAGYILSPGTDPGRTPIKAMVTNPPGATHPITFKKV